MSIPVVEEVLVVEPLDAERGDPAAACVGWKDIRSA